MLPEITIATLMAGRDYALAPWYRHLGALDYPRDRIHLRVLSNAAWQAFHGRARARLATLHGYASIDYAVERSVRRSTRAFVERAETLPEHADVISQLYNALYERVETEWFLTLEDDVLAPGDAIRRLLACYRAFPRVGWAAGLLNDRHDEGPLLWDLQLGRVFPPGDDCQECQLQLRAVPRPWGTRPIGCGHMGLTLFRRSICEELRDGQGPVFKARSPFAVSGGLLGCDLIACAELALRGYLRICDYGLRALHLDSRGGTH